MKTDEELFGALREATNGLLFMSESVYPLEVIRWSGSEVGRDSQPLNLWEGPIMDHQGNIILMTMLGS
jgi:hypothetical protein